MNFHPKKYYAGLTRKEKIQRKKEIEKFGKMDWKNPKAYVGFATNTRKKTKRSQYTAQWDAMFPNAKSLHDRASVSGVPQSILEDVYNRGLAAWRTGHRPGANPQQWGYARVSSFLLCGKTHYGPDSDLVRKAKTMSTTARKWFKKCPV